MIEEHDSVWREKLLESPPPRKPRTISESRPGFLMVLRSNWDIGEVRIAYLSAPGPLKHRVYSFRKLRAARFIDTARINPLVSSNDAPYSRILTENRQEIKKAYGIYPAFFPSLGAAACDLGPPCHGRPSSLLQVLEGDFLVAPSVRKNGIIWNFTPEEFMKLQRCSVK